MIQKNIFKVMGNTCSGDPQANPIEVRTMPSQPPSSDPKFYKKSTTLSIRFAEVEKIRSSTIIQNNKYSFMLPIKDSNQVIRVEAPVVVSYADQLNLKSKITKGVEIKGVKALPAIIDTMDTGTDRQIYHNFTVEKDADRQLIEGEDLSHRENYSVKCYGFKNYHDPVFKNALYEAALYKYLDDFTKNPAPILKDFFIIERGTPQSIVFVHGHYLCTLFDILQYRQLANLPYTQQEQLFIANQILNKYRILRMNNIVHRDIRPSKIFLSEPGAEIDFEGKVVEHHKGRNFKGLSRHGYQFINLESARRYSPQEMRQNPHGMFQSVRGVPLYSSDQLKSHQNNRSELGTYDAIKNDRVQLAKTLAGLLTLNPYEQNLNLSNLEKINKSLGSTIAKLMNSSENQSPIQKLLRQIVPKQTHLTILESDHKIAVNLLPKLLKTAHEERIDRSQMEAMFLLHQQDSFSEKLNSKIEENYQNRKYYDNVQILDRIGKYYEGAGVANNDYYREEVNLLLELVEEERMKGFNTSDLLEQANNIYQNKLSGSIRTPITMVKLAIENCYADIKDGQHETALRRVNEALRVASEMNTLPISMQLKLLQVKGQLESEINDPQIGEEFFEKGLEMSNNRRNFDTQVQLLETKSTFQYLLGKNMLKKVESQQTMGFRSSINARSKAIGKGETLLLEAKQTKTELPGTNPIKLGKVYEALGDLSFFRQNYSETAKYYERTYRLYESPDHYEVSDSLKLEILQKMHRLYLNKLEDVQEQQKIKRKIAALKKREEKDLRDPRKNFDKLKMLSHKRHKKGIFRGEGIIAEQEIEEDEEEINSPQKIEAGGQINAAGITNSNYENDLVRQSSGRGIGQESYGGINESMGRRGIQDSQGQGYGNMQGSQRGIEDGYRGGFGESNLRGNGSIRNSSAIRGSQGFMKNSERGIKQSYGGGYDMRESNRGASGIRESSSSQNFGNMKESSGIRQSGRSNQIKDSYGGQQSYGIQNSYNERPNMNSGIQESHNGGGFAGQTNFQSSNGGIRQSGGIRDSGGYSNNYGQPINSGIQNSYGGVRESQGYRGGLEESSPQYNFGESQNQGGFNMRESSDGMDFQNRRPIEESEGFYNQNQMKDNSDSMMFKYQNPQFDQSSPGMQGMRPNPNSYDDF